MLPGHVPSSSYEKRLKDRAEDKLGRRRTEILTASEAEQFRSHPKCWNSAQRAFSITLWSGGIVPNKQDRKLNACKLQDRVA